MSEAEEIWRAKTDEELLQAGEELSEYTEDGERIIRAELRRRGLPEPGPPIGACARCGRAIAPNHQADECPHCGEPLTPGILRALGAVAGRLREEVQPAVTPAGQLLTVTWELVRSEGANFSMLRANIPGGWLVANETDGALVFVPDAEHRWNENS
jgi:hypothetical protein